MQRFNTRIIFVFLHYNGSSVFALGGEFFSTKKWCRVEGFPVLPNDSPATTVERSRPTVVGVPQ